MAATLLAHSADGTLPDASCQQSLQDTFTSPLGTIAAGIPAAALNIIQPADSLHLLFTDTVSLLQHHTI